VARVSECPAPRRAGATHTERLLFDGDRDAVREQAVAHALNGLLRLIE